MTNREEEELLSQSVIGDRQTQTIASDTTLLNNAITIASEITAPECNGIISDLHWSDNQPASASPSSGFSDDDSLAGANDIGDAKTIEQIVEMVKKLGKKGLIKEYAEIRARQPSGAFDIAKLRSNCTKNRYTDVLCLDHSRVVLSKEDQDDPTGDYINANYGLQAKKCVHLNSG